MPTETYVRNDKGFDIAFTLTNPDGTAMDLTGATPISFKVKLLGGTALKFTGICTITDAPNGKCKYTVAASDFDASGDYIGEVEVTYGGGTKIVTAQFSRFRVIPDAP